MQGIMQAIVEAIMARWALDLDNVRAGYGETVVLEDIRFALGASETVSIIGRNGVGKTTLLATVMGHTTLHGGKLSLHDKDISTMAIGSTSSRAPAWVATRPTESSPLTACRRRPTATRRPRPRRPTDERS